MNVLDVPWSIFENGNVFGDPQGRDGTSHWNWTHAANMVIKHDQRTENRRGYHQYESLTFGQAHSKVESKSLMSWVVTHFTKAVQDLSSFLS